MHERNTEINISSNRLQHINLQRIYCNLQLAGRDRSNDSKSLVKAAVLLKMHQF